MAIVGYAILDVIGNKMNIVEYGAITTDAGVPFDERLHIIFTELNVLINKYKPDDMAIEELFFNKNVKTAIMVGHARGVEILSAVNNGLSVYEYTPLQIKEAVVGYGRAEKVQIQKMVKMILNLDEIPKPDDVADAIAVAICHGHSLKYKEQFKLR